MRHVALYALLFCAGSAHAYRREFIVTRDGVRVPGAQVCFSRVTATNNAYALFFSHGEDVGCLPADTAIDMPVGVWHVFARQGTSGASATQDYLANRGDPMPEQGYQSLEIPLHPAGVLDVTKLLPALGARNASVGIWLDSTSETLSTYIPLVPGEHEIAVPANIPFVPIVTSGGKPLRLGSPMTVAARERQALPDLFALPARTDLVAWLKLDLLLAKAVKEHPPDPPVIQLRTGTTRIAPRKRASLDCGSAASTCRSTPWSDFRTEAMAGSV